MASIQNNILAVVPARAGSKGIPGKNLALCDGVPLLKWAVDYGRHFDLDVIVTTDDTRIARYAEAELGVESRVTAGDYLHGDTCRGLDVWLDAWDKRRYPVSVYLEPTCPTRMAEDFERCIAMLDKFSSVATVSHATPQEKLIQLDKNKVVVAPKTGRRQDCAAYYKANGACYAMRADHKGGIWENAGAVVISQPRISIDTLSDLYISELIIQSVKNFSRST